MTAGCGVRRGVAGARAPIVLLCILLGGCFRFGPVNLNIDQIDYSRAVAEGETLRRHPYRVMTRSSGPGVSAPVLTTGDSTRRSG